jgi:hypothetical protein
MYPDADNAFCLFFLSSLNSSNFKSILLRSFVVFFVVLELILLISMPCPSAALATCYFAHESEYLFEDYLQVHS